MPSTRKRPTARIAAVIAAAALAAAAAGCGETGDTDPTPVQTFKITPAANSTPSSSRSPAPSAVPTTDEPPAPPATPGTSTILEVAGISSEFDVEELTAPPGTITVEFDNQDAGVLHNIHFFEGQDADGKSVAETELAVGPIEQTVTFNAKPGVYFYQCDAHPTTMEGTLKVE